MKKKDYIAPAVEQMEIDVEAHLLQASVTGTAMEDGTTEIDIPGMTGIGLPEIGDPTGSADSRTGFSVWNVLGIH